MAVWWTLVWSAGAAAGLLGQITPPNEGPGILSPCRRIPVHHGDCRDPSGPAASNPQPEDAFPIQAVAPAYRERVQAVLSRPVVRRRSPVVTSPCHPPLLEWLQVHPQWVAAWWRRIGIDPGWVEPVPDGYHCRIDRTLAVRFHEVCDRPGLRIVYCVGEWTRLPGMCWTAEMVMVQRYEYLKQPEGGCVIVQQIDGFGTTPGAVLRTLAQWRPGVSEAIADNVLANMLVFFGAVCRAVHEEPDWAIGVFGAIHSGFPPEETAELVPLLEQALNTRRLAPTAALEPAGRHD